MRLGPDSYESAVHSFYGYAAALFLVCACSCLGLAQQRPPQAHPPSVAMVAVPRVVVPDVRGRPPEDAQAILRRAGLQPGTTSTSPGPGIVGTVWQQEPQQNTVVLRGTIFNLVLVALPTNPSDGDEEFSRRVPKLIGLTPNQASNLLEHSRLLLGNVSAGDGNGPEGTIYAQKPQAGSWVKIASRIDVGIVEPQKTSGGKEEIIWVLVPNLFGQTEKAAEEVLGKCGLSVGGVSTGIASVPAGTVFGQDPLPNASVGEGTQVSLRIAQAVPPHESTVPVPNLIHQDVRSAGALLAQVGLQLGEAKSEESGGTPNSITAQSPDAGTPVERGTSVNVVIAQQIPPVPVPNIVQHGEADAVAILQRVGLQLGAVSEKQGDASSGTILSQKPQAGERVRTGTAVDVLVSRQVTRQLTVMVDQANPKRGEALGFHAHLDPPQRGMKYGFTFGDGERSAWLTTSKTTHTYRSAGDFQVQAFAAAGNTTITSEIVTVAIPPFPWAIVSALTVGVLALGGAGFLYRGWRLFHKWIRVVPKMDVGTQRLSIESSEDWNQSVRVRVVQDIGECRVLWPAGPGPRKAETT